MYDKSGIIILLSQISASYFTGIVWSKLLPLFHVTALFLLI